MIEWTITSAIVNITASSKAEGSASASGSSSTSTAYRTWLDTPGTPGNWDEGVEIFSESYKSGSSSSGMSSYSEDSAGTTNYSFDDIGAHTQEGDGGPYYDEPPVIDPEITPPTVNSGSTVITATIDKQTSTTVTELQSGVKSGTYTLESASVEMTHTKWVDGYRVTSPDTSDPVGPIDKTYIHTETGPVSTFETTITVEATTFDGTQQFFGNYNVASVAQAASDEVFLTYEMPSAPQPEKTWTYGTATRITLRPTYATYAKSQIPQDASFSTTTNSATDYTVTLRRITYTASTITTVYADKLPHETITATIPTVRTTNSVTDHDQLFRLFSGEVAYLSKSDRTVWDISHYALSRQHHTHVYDVMGGSYVSTKVAYALGGVTTSSSGNTTNSVYETASGTVIEYGFEPGESPPTQGIVRTQSSGFTTTETSSQSSSSSTAGNTVHPDLFCFDAVINGGVASQTRWYTSGVAIDTKTGAYFTGEADISFWLPTAKDGRSRGTVCRTVRPYSDDAITVFGKSFTYASSTSNASGVTIATNSGIIGVSGAPITVTLEGNNSPLGGGPFLSDGTVVEDAPEGVYYNYHSAESTTFFKGEATVVSVNASGRNVLWRPAAAFISAVATPHTCSYSIVPRHITTWVDV